MVKYIIKRLVAGVVTLWAVVTITFILIHSIPGGPFDREKPLPKEVKAQIERSYNLDKPLSWQYMDYMKKLILKFDLGPSFKQKGISVNWMIKNYFPVSARLGLAAIIFVVVVGVPLGLIAALKQGKWQDNFVMFLATLGITVPAFVVGTLLIYVFSQKLGWLPVMGLKSPKHYILPVIALSGGSIAMITRLTRSSLLDVIRQDYIRTARAKGLSEKIVTYKHALRNALIPVITFLGPLVSGVLLGSFVIERIFTIPGLGRSFVDSIGNRDYTAILGLTIFDAAILVIANLIVDLLYVFVDPRIKLES